MTKKCLNENFSGGDHKSNFDQIEEKKFKNAMKELKDLRKTISNSYRLSYEAFNEEDYKSDLEKIKDELKSILKEFKNLRNSQIETELLTMDQICKELKLSRPSVKKLVYKKKKLKPILLLDQDLRFKKSDILNMINDSYKEIK